MVPNDNISAERTKTDTDNNYDDYRVGAKYNDGEGTIVSEQSSTHATGGDKTANNGGGLTYHQRMIRNLVFAPNRTLPNNKNKT